MFVTAMVPVTYVQLNIPELIDIVSTVDWVRIITAAIFPCMRWVSWKKQKLKTEALV